MLVVLVVLNFNSTFKITSQNSRVLQRSYHTKAGLVLYLLIFSTSIATVALHAPSHLEEAARSTSKWLFIVEIHSWDALIRSLPSEATHQRGSASHSSAALQRGARITATLGLNGATGEEGC